MRWALTQAGEASPDEVWQRYAELDRWRRWGPFIVAVEAQGTHLEPGLAGGTVAALQLTGAPPVVLAYLAPAQLALRSLVRG